MFLCDSQETVDKGLRVEQIRESLWNLIVQFRCIFYDHNFPSWHLESPPCKYLVSNWALQNPSKMPSKIHFPTPPSRPQSTKLLVMMGYDGSRERKLDPGVIMAVVCKPCLVYSVSSVVLSWCAVSPFHLGIAIAYQSLNSPSLPGPDNGGPQFIII